jgi:hypothetical protein
MPKSKYGTPFKMKGHALPGINQRSETKNLADGRYKPSAFTKKESDEVFIARAERQKTQAINKLIKKAESEGLSGQAAIDAAEKQYKKNISMSS